MYGEGEEEECWTEGSGWKIAGKIQGNRCFDW